MATDKMDSYDLVREELAKKKSWPKALQVLGALEAAEPGVPVSTEALCRAARCSERQVRGYLLLVKAYVEDVEQKKLCNLRGVGYWLGESEADKLNEALKEGSRMLSHATRIEKTLSLVDKSHINSVEGIEIYGVCIGLGTTARLLNMQYRELTNNLLSSRNAKVRQRLMAEQASAPIRELIDIDEDPRAAVQSAMRDVEKP